MAQKIGIDLQINDKGSPAIQKLNSALARMKGGIDKIPNSFKKVNDAIKRTIPSMDGLKKSFAKAQESSKMLAASIGVGLVAAAAAFGAAMYSALQRATQSKSISKMLAGGAQELENIREHANKVGLSFEETNEIAENLGKTFKNAGVAASVFKTLTDIKANQGLSPEKLKELSGEMLKLANKAAGLGEFQKFAEIIGTGFNMDQMVKATGKPLKELEKLLKEGNLPAEDLLKTMRSLSSAAPGVDAVAEAQTNLTAQLARTQSILGSFTDNIFSAVFGSPEEAAKAIAGFNDWLTQMTSTQGISDFIKLLKDLEPAFYIVAGAITAALLPALGAMAVAGWAAISPLLPFIAVGAAVGAAIYLLVKNWDFLKETMVSFADDVVEVFSNLPTLFKEIGGDIVQGIWDGIMFPWRTMVKGVMGLIDLLPTAAKKALGIASPSKVFKSIGKNMMDGLHISIKDEFKGVEKTLKVQSRTMSAAFENTKISPPKYTEVVDDSVNASAQFLARNKNSKKSSSSDVSNRPIVSPVFKSPITINMAPGSNVDKAAVEEMEKNITYALIQQLNKGLLQS